MSLQAPRPNADADPVAASGDPLAAEIDALAPWFHNLHLPSGHLTAASHPLGDFPAFKWRQIEGTLDVDLTGVRALDVGCNAGYYSFALAARGAEVLAVDVDEHYLSQGRWAASHLDPAHRVRFERMHLYDLIELDERFDLILFLGVLYHLRYPQLALDLLAPLVGGRMIVQTLTIPAHGQREPPRDLPFSDRGEMARADWPRAAFIEHSLAGDPTNWWAPDEACVRAMLRSAGLRVLASPGHEIFVCDRDPAADPEITRLRDEELTAATGRRSHAPPGGDQSSQRK